MKSEAEESKTFLDITVWQVVRGDIDAIVALYSQADELHFQALPFIFHPPADPQQNHRYIENLLNEQDAGLFVAELAGKIVGALHVELHNSPQISIFLPRRFAVVANLVVEKDLHRSGIGLALMEYTHDWAIKKGVSEVELNVWEFNQGAIAFYEKLGYTTASRRMWKKLRQE